MTRKAIHILRKTAVTGAMGSLALLGAQGSLRAASSRDRQPQGGCVTINLSNISSSGSNLYWSCIGNTSLYAGSLVSGGFSFSANASTSPPYALAISDAIFTTASSTSSRNDAFDGYGGLFVDIGNGLRPYNDPDGILDVTGTTVTGSSMNMPGSSVNVSAQFHFFTDQRLARIAYTFTNGIFKKGAEKGLGLYTVNAWIGGDLGSDGGTTLENTSNGNTTLNASDNWLVTSDGGYAPGDDPVILHVPFGPDGEVIPVNTAAPEAGNEFISYRYTFTLNPGESKTLVWFVGLAEDVAGANAMAGQFNSIPENLLTGLPAGSTVVNWAPAGVVAGPATPVPVGNPLGLFALAGLLGYIGWRRLSVQAQA